MQAQSTYFVADWERSAGPAEMARAALVPIDNVPLPMESVTLDERDALSFRHGRAVALAGADIERLAVRDAAGHLLGLARREASLLGVREVGSIAAAMDLLTGWPGRGATQLVTPTEILRLAAVRHVRAVPAPIEEDLRVDRGGAEQERAQDRRAVLAARRARHRRELTEDVAAITAGRAAELNALIEMEAGGIEFPK